MSDTCLGLRGPRKRSDPISGASTWPVGKKENNSHVESQCIVGECRFRRVSHRGGVLAIGIVGRYRSASTAAADCEPRYNAGN